MIIQPDLIAEILAERARQDAEHGGPARDDLRVPIEWADAIQYQLDALTDEGGHWPPDIADSSSVLIRARLIKIIALGIAGVQAIDRASGSVV